MISIFFYFYIFTVGYALADDQQITNTVNHKNLQLNLYLDLIKYNTQEKLGILPYILDNPAGTYLEVGTGGDPIADLLSKIPDTMSPHIIASDVDSNVLASLPLRHPKLQSYINNHKKGPRLSLQQLDGTDMACFTSESFDGINASAVVHEIVSYAGGIEGLTNFFRESFRVLKKHGTLIYRDPESVANKKEVICANFKTPSIRLFGHIFLGKFLDMKYGALAQNNNKKHCYDINEIQFHCYKKGSLVPSIMNYEEYFNTRSYEIDFSRSYSIYMPRGLCREIERHYLTYLHQCNPLVFAKCVPHIDSEAYFVNFLAHSTATIFSNFLKKHNTVLHDNSISLSVKHLLDKEISSATQAIEYGILLHFASQYKEQMLTRILQKHGLDTNLYIISIGDGDVLLDYRILGLLYDEITTMVFDANNCPINANDLVHAQYLQREGEETYIYYSADELITKVAEITMAIGEDYVLCPISPDHNKFVPRLSYDVVLMDSIEIKDSLGYNIKISEGKRIIHFAKMSLKEAIPIWDDIIVADPNGYQSVQKFLNEKVLSYKLSLQ